MKIKFIYLLEKPKRIDGMTNIDLGLLREVCLRNKENIIFTIHYKKYNELKML